MSFPPSTGFEAARDLLDQLRATAACGSSLDPNGVAEVKRLLSDAADDGDVEAQSFFAHWLREGDTGVAPDPALAVQYFRLAADQGCAKSMTCVGNCFEAGVGVAKDPTEAVRWFRKAAKRGEPVAKARLGMAYMCGSGVRRDYAQAALYLLSVDTAQLDFAEPEYHIGMLFKNGWGGQDKDMAKAADFFGRACDKAYAMAYYELGRCYETGAITTGDSAGVDREHAMYFYGEAASSGTISDADRALAEAAIVRMRLQ